MRRLTRAAVNNGVENLSLTTSGGSFLSFRHLIDIGIELE